MCSGNNNVMRNSCSYCVKADCSGKHKLSLWDLSYFGRFETTPSVTLLQYYPLRHTDFF